MKIVIDKRESSKRVDKAHELFSGEGLDVVDDTIQVGDYLLFNDNNECIAAIEYKTYGDFVSSIINGHLESQLNDMDNYTLPLLFVVGSYGTWSKRTKGFLHVNKKSIDGFKVKVALAHKTKILQFDSEAEALNAMVMILHRRNSSTGVITLPERHKSTGDSQLDMYLSLRGVGLTKAQKYSSAVPFPQFLMICRYPTAKEMFRLKGIQVTDALIDYCRELWGD